jgi:hypothetical protein
VNGGLKEAETRTAELKDVEPEDFARFLEYAYRRDYTVPYWVLDESIVTTEIVERGHDSMPGSPVFPASSGTPSARGGLFGDMPVEDTPAPPPLDQWGSFPTGVNKKKDKKKVVLQPQDI